MHRHMFPLCAYTGQRVAGRARVLRRTLQAERAGLVTKAHQWALET